MMGGYGMWGNDKRYGGANVGMGYGANTHGAQQMRFVDGTAYFGAEGAQMGAHQQNHQHHQHQHHQHQHHNHHHPPSYRSHEEISLDVPPGGFFNVVDCRWKEVIKAPVQAIDQVTRACSTQRHLIRDKNKKGFPNLCEDYHMSVCMQGQHCKLFHLSCEWVNEMRKPHQEALEVAREEFQRIQAEGKTFTVFCPNLKETLPVPANFMHFTRGLFLREEERVKRQVQHGGKQSESHQNPSVCQLFIKTNGDRQCKWGELCNQAHPQRGWLLQRHDLSVSHVMKCNRDFDCSNPYATWEALDPDTNGRLTVQKRHLRFTRGLYAKESTGTRLASICMLYLKQYDGSCAGSGCTAGDLCNQIHVDCGWLLDKRIEIRMSTGEFDETRHRRDWYQGVHFPAGKRAAWKWHSPNATTSPKPSPPSSKPATATGLPTSPSPSYVSGSSQPVVSPATTALPTPADRSFATSTEESSEGDTTVFDWFARAMMAMDSNKERPALSINVSEPVEAGRPLASPERIGGEEEEEDDGVLHISPAGVAALPKAKCSPINRRREMHAAMDTLLAAAEGRTARSNEGSPDKTTEEEEEPEEEKEGFTPFGIESLTALMEEMAGTDQAN